MADDREASIAEDSFCCGQTGGENGFGMAGSYDQVQFLWTKKSPERKLSERDGAAAIGAGQIAKASSKIIFQLDLNQRIMESQVRIYALPLAASFSGNAPGPRTILNPQTKTPPIAGRRLHSLWPIAESNHGHADFQSAKFSIPQR